MVQLCDSTPGVTGMVGCFTVSATVACMDHHPVRGRHYRGQGPRKGTLAPLPWLRVSVAVEYLWQDASVTLGRGKEVLSQMGLGGLDSQKCHTAQFKS